jgi:hypothetical protein
VVADPKCRRPAVDRGGRGRGIGASKSSKVGLLTRGVERSGIDCRTVGAVRRGDVHDR